MEDRAYKYANELSLLIKHKTVSKYYETDFTKFFKLQSTLEKLFPKLFAVCEKKLFGGSLLLKWKGKSSDKPIMFMNHHDVVDAEGKWKYPPYSGKIVDDKIYGRGTIDTKSGLYAMLKAGEELVESGFVPNNDIYFLSACTEEVDGTGAKLIADYLLESEIKFDAIFDEGGMVVDDPLGFSSGKFAMVGIAEKGCHTIKFTAKSLGGHASAPPKNTPLVRLGRFMAEVDKTHKFKSKVTKELLEMLKRFAINMTGIKKIVFSHPNVISPLLKIIMPKVSATANAMLKTTIVFTVASGSNTHNVIPQEAYVLGNMRFSHHQGSENSLKVVEKIAKKYGIEMEVTDRECESNVSSFNSKSFKNIEEGVKKFYPNTVTVPFVSNTGADIRFMSKLSDNCLRFTPFQVTDSQLDTIHGIDENLNIEFLPKAVDFYKFLMEK